jgi:hypothetical protein
MTAIEDAAKSKRFAIVLLGPAATGKSTTFMAIDKACRASGDSACMVNLDDGWGPGEIRRTGTREDRYADLIGRSASILVVELACGEPNFGQGPEEGASRKPQDWYNVLKDDGRDVRIFRLDAPHDVREDRLKERSWGDDMRTICHMIATKIVREWKVADKLGVTDQSFDTSKEKPEQIAEHILKSLSSLGDAPQG